jgi:ring-1,2-phenylacetyl-CoA epoxidase subunit PaaD
VPSSSKVLNHSNSATRREAILRALESVTDPEIPVLSVIDMGIIAGVRIDGDHVTIDMTPTFVGCPALDVIRHDIRTAVSALGETDINVNVVFDPPWTSDRLTDNGRKKLKDFGLAPPGPRCGTHQTPDLEQTPCPYCGSDNTDLESLFGPTLCRSIHYCRACLQSFEHFKTV